MAKFLEILDTASHWAFDWYIHRQLPGWGGIQYAQWHLCNLYERKNGML